MPPMLQGTRPAQNRLCLCHCYASPLQAHLADDAGSRTGPRFASATAPMNLRWKQTALGTQTRLRHRYKSVLLGLAATATKLFTNKTDHMDISQEDQDIKEQVRNSDRRKMLQVATSLHSGSVGKNYISTRFCYWRLLLDSKNLDQISLIHSTLSGECLKILTIIKVNDLVYHKMLAGMVNHSAPLNFTL
ncbi:uncharacterized protein LOC125485855 isoform X2 [Rhincodon typus]|uniref:uncharacterized protein LOC125485855 isoform X2 n=1 Tax=Rhincodon typus TaxID=259920 RepID=UPI00202ECAF6|nr:uncharacterized protein LOC125485855 isoform X2 [Rhincodon typus]